jgi:ABC-type uncharacterized transport system auxiliary subunit
MNIDACRVPWRPALVLSAALLAGGCGSVRYSQNYLLDLRSPAAAAESARGSLGQLVVHEFACPDYLCDGRIVYRPTANEVGFYEYHRWAVSPRQMIAESVAGRVQAMALFTNVALRDADAAVAYRLTGSVERFEEVDDGRGVQAVCELSAQLLEVRSKTIIWSRSETAAVPVVDRSVPGVVASLSTATRTAVDALIASIASRLAGRLDDQPATRSSTDARR